MLSPILLFAYNRADHLAQTYEALKNCPEAKDSELFVFSDGAKNEASEKGVNEVRTFLKSIDNTDDFAGVHIIESPTNKGLATSIIDGVSEVIDRFGRVIVLEDDCVPSVHFLRFMNNCLDCFEGDKRIGAIAGYTPDFGLPEAYSRDVFTSYRSCSWGWATWADRWADVDWDFSERKAYFKPSFVRKFNSSGSDRFMRLYRQSKGNGSSWSVRFGAHLVKNDQLTVYPRYSYIRNIGCDESGVHSKAEDAECMAVDLSKAIENPKIEFVPQDTALIRRFKKHYSGGFESDVKRAVASSLIVARENLR